MSRLPAILAAPEFWLRLCEIGALNLLLSGDNAVVIALAVRVLPKRQRLLGQIWGTVGAVVLRLGFVGVVSLLLRVPFLRVAGGFALLWIALRLIRPQAEGAEAVRHGASFWEAIWIILIADVTMSLDNVLAIAAAAHGDFMLVTLGIVSSLPIVVWGSSVLASLMNRYTWIIWTGGALLGWVAGEMILEDPVVEARLGPHAHLLGYAVPLALATVLFVIGWRLARRQEISRLQGAAPAGRQERSR